MSTNSFAQQEPQPRTNLDPKKPGYNFIEPEIEFPEKSSVIEGATDSEDIPEMTKIQWKRYYKKIGLEE